MSIKKITILFPPGDVLTSVVWEKEKNTKIIELLKRLTTLRGLPLDALKVFNDIGKEIKESALEQTFDQSGLLFLELVDEAEQKKEKEKNEAKVEEDEDFDSKAITGIPAAIKDNIVPGCTIHLTLREQLYDHEWELLQNFKAKNGQLCSSYSDEFVMSCLFARRLDTDRALALLQNNLKWRKEKGLMNIPKMSELDIRLFDPYHNIPGSRTKTGNNITYMSIRKVTPGVEPFTIATLCKWMAWFNFVGVFADGMDGPRHGICLVGDFSEIGWKNFDVDYNKANAALWQDVFPGRPKRFLIVNPPLIFSAIFKIMSTFLKKKIVNRFTTVELKDIPKYIDKSNLLASMGGSFEYSHDQYVANLKEWCIKHEERLIAPGRQN